MLTKQINALAEWNDNKRQCTFRTLRLSAALAIDPLIYRASRGHLCDSTAFLLKYITACVGLIKVRNDVTCRPNEMRYINLRLTYLLTY